MMTMLLTALLAEINPNGPKPGDWRFGWDRVAIIAAAATVMAFVAWLILRYAAGRERCVAHSPWCLFKDVCKAHGLSLRERQLMTRLARQHGLEHPTALFVEPNLWEPQRLGSGWSRCLPELERLRKRLFAAR